MSEETFAQFLARLLALPKEEQDAQISVWQREWWQKQFWIRETIHYVPCSQTDPPIPSRALREALAGIQKVMEETQG